MVGAMKIDVASQLCGIDGEGLTYAKPAEGTTACETCGQLAPAQEQEPITLRYLACSVLQLRFDKNEPGGVPGDEQMKRHALAVRIYADDKCDMTTEEIVLVKKLLSWLYAPIYIGPSYALLEGLPAKAD